MSASTISRITRKLNPNEISNREAEFKDFIDEKIIGQENGRRAAQRAFRRTQAKVRIGNQPFYSILAIGPTSCGKSELAYRLAEGIHNNRDAVLKIDASEFQHPLQLSALTGASPNYVGFVDRNSPNYEAPDEDEKDTYAALTQHNLVWSRRGSSAKVTIVLIDEWEKGCKEFNDVLLSILRDGRYTLGNGEEVDFRRCIFVLTSNLGSAAVEEQKDKPGLGFGCTDGISKDNAEKIVNDHLKRFAAPEFRARLEENGEIRIFDALTEEQIAQICELKVHELCAEWTKQVNINIEVDAAALQWLLQKTGSVAKLNGAVKTHITDELNNALAMDSVAPGNTVSFTYIEGEDSLSAEVHIELYVGDGTEDFSSESIASLGVDLAAEVENSGRRTDDDVNITDVRHLGEDDSQANVNNGTKSCDHKGCNNTSETSDGSNDHQLEFQIHGRAQNIDELRHMNGVVVEALEQNEHITPLHYRFDVVEPFVASYFVKATIEAIHTIKRQFPELRIVSKSFEIA